MILTFLRGKIPGNLSIDTFLLHKAFGIALKYKSEGMFVLWLPEPVLVIYSPEAIKFFSNEPSLTDKPMYYRFFETFMKNGPLSVGRMKIKEKKKFISPAFYPSMMKTFMTTMNEHAECFVHELKQLEHGTTVDLHEIMETRMLKLFFESSLGIKLDSVENNNSMAKFLNLMTRLNSYVSRRFFRPWLHMNFLLHVFSSGRKHLKMAKEMDFIAMQGYDTISTSLSWTLWQLGLHPDVQEKAYREIETVTDEIIQYEDTRNLIYLENVIKESLRLYPAVPMYGRKSDKELHFGKHTIPRGTTVVFSSFLLHHNPDVYLKPESFNPDRFTEKDSNIKPWSLVPFAEGARSCIGKNYAMLAMKLFLVQILRTFKIVSLTHKDDVKLSWKLMLKSKTPLSVKFIPRQL